jgi:aminopeptidase N
MSIWLIVCLFVESLAQFASAIPDNVTLPHRQTVPIKTAASSWFDVSYYRLELNIITPASFLTGKVTITGVCHKSGEQTLTFDLVQNMHIDSIVVDGQSRPFFQNNESFNFSLASSTSIGSHLSVEIIYRGTPISTGLSSFSFNFHSGVPWVYSLSQPYGAKDWWPCKDDPGDKADSADINVTCDSTFKVGSNGILVSVINNANGTSTHHWKERYPIASYLISVALTNYVQFSNWYRYSATDSMEVLNYILPEHYAEAFQQLPLTIDMLKIFSDLFGLYPFIKEKYGHAEFGRGGAMEHQTMTSTTNFNELTIAHELAHQWFGDMITCQSWSDLWLNEGFAQYCSALYLERQYGNSAYWTYMGSQFDQAYQAQGAIGAPDTSSARNLFNSRLVYSKGASVLHMLRRVLGDTLFFRVLYTYAHDPVLMYSTATIHDFQRICETVADTNLDYFFQEWIYGTGFPNYFYSWNWKRMNDSSLLTLDITQVNSQSAPPFFTMPIDVHITAGGRDTIFTVLNKAQSQQFQLRCDVQPSMVLLDPEKWILRYVFTGADRPPTHFFLEQNYPNPFNSTTTIMYWLPVRSAITLKIYDLLGREVRTLADDVQSAGVHECQWVNPSNASGVYFYRLTTENILLQKKMLLLK